MYNYLDILMINLMKLHDIGKDLKLAIQNDSVNNQYRSPFKSIKYMIEAISDTSTNAFIKDSFE